MSVLTMSDVYVSIDDKPIIKGISLTIRSGEVHAVMGPNGSGKSTLAYALIGHPSYTVTQGAITLNGEDMTALAADQRARLGMFLGFQYPIAIPGVNLANFIRASLKAVRGDDVPVRAYRKELTESMAELKIDKSFMKRYINDGFSGGEKKRIEILQMSMLKPQMAILDETDSGLDIDALKIVAEGINKLRGPELGVLLITHYQRLLNYITPDHVHVLVDGRLVRSGGRELALELERDGYDKIIASLQPTVEVS